MRIKRDPKNPHGGIVYFSTQELLDYGCSLANLLTERDVKEEADSGLAGIRLDNLGKIILWFEIRVLTDEERRLCDHLRVVKESIHLKPRIALVQDDS
ncbi:MAG: hypothetical protein JWN89_215 [Parcubacteria group bacterium]|nr:hypothetical protein [Parcubacteria group bacterium]